MKGMFALANTFNGDLSTWSIARVTDMSDMFYEASAFNRDLSKWNVVRTTTMGSMFYNAQAFGSRGLSKWNVANVKNMYVPHVREFRRQRHRLQHSMAAEPGGQSRRTRRRWPGGQDLLRRLQPRLEQPYPEDLRMLEIMRGVLTHTLRPRVPRADEVPHPDLAALVAACVRSRPGARPSFVEIERRLQVVLREIE